jgi:hypothetical protein
VPPSACVRRGPAARRRFPSRPPTRATPSPSSRSARAPLPLPPTHPSLRELGHDDYRRHRAHRAERS